jgi:hypothetical protein
MIFCQLQEIVKGLKRLAKEIEKFGPAIDREKSPQNAEYPWRQGGRLILPCQHGFFMADFSQNLYGELIELLREAADELISR